MSLRDNTDVKQAVDWVLTLNITQFKVQLACYGSDNFPIIASI